MTIRQHLPIGRTYPELSGVIPIAGFAVALAAGVLQAAWWFSHGWTWSNLPRFLMSGEPVVWCVILILAGASLSWTSLRRAGHGQEGREWAIAGLMVSMAAPILIMPGILLIVVLLLLIGTLIGRGSRRVVAGPITDRSPPPVPERLVFTRLRRGPPG